MQARGTKSEYVHEVSEGMTHLEILLELVFRRFKTLHDVLASSCGGD